MDFDNAVNEIKSKLDTNKAELEQKNAELEKKNAELTSKVDNALSELNTAKEQINSELTNIKRLGMVGKRDDTELYRKYVNALFRKDRAQHMEFATTRAEINLDVKAAQGITGTDAAGGYAVPFQLEKEILKKERDGNIMRQLCSSQTVSTPDVHWNVDVGGTEAGWVGELTSRANTAVPELSRVQAFWGELYANPKASYRLLDDAEWDIESWYNESVGDTFADKFEEAFLTGDADNKPKGLLQYTFSTVKDTTRPTQTFQKISGALDYDSILSLYYSLRQVYRKQGNCSWLMNGSTIEALRKIKDKQDRYLWVDHVADGMQGTLLGLPVYESRFMPEANANGNLAILFGNFKKAYTILDLHGLRIVRDPYTDKTSVQFYTSKRVGNIVKDSCAVKALAISGLSS